MNYHRTHRFILGAAASAVALLLTSFTDVVAGHVGPNTGAVVGLLPGDIIYADSGNAIDGGILVKVNPATGNQVILSAGGLLMQPLIPVVDQRGAIIVSDTSGRVIRVDPLTGNQTLLADNSSGRLGSPLGISVDRRGGVLVANAQALLRIDPSTGQIQTISSGGYFMYPIGLAVGGGGEIFVLNTGPVKQIIRVNPNNGAQRVVSQGMYLNNPQALVANGSDLFVTDVATPDGNFGIGRVLHIDQQTGAQTIVAEGGYLVGPVGITVDTNGDLLVGDAYTINPASPDLYDGAIVRISASSGRQTLICRGEGSHVNPRGVAVVPVR